MNGTCKRGDITAIDIDEERDERQNEELEASLITSNYQKKQDHKIDSCYYILDNDQRDILVKVYKEFNKMACHYDPKEGIYYIKGQKISKQLREKMKNLDLIIRNYSKTSYENIIEKFKNKNELFQLLILICESVLFDAISLCDQYSGVSSTVATNPLKVLWNEMRNRSCQFLGPQVQEDVLNFVLRALEQFPRLTRRVLVYYVVFMLKKDYPKVSEKSIGHVVQLLCRAGCFKVEKRDKDASLMELKIEYTKYKALRRQHDTQIIKIGMESGIILTREEWSTAFYGDLDHTSEMQSIMSTLPSYQIYKLKKLIDDFSEKIESNKLEDISSFDKKDFEFIASINFEKKQPGTGNSLLDEEDNNDLLNDALSENFDFSNYSDLMQKSKTHKVHSLWLILCKCLQRTLKILEAHVDFSSKIMNKMIANQNIIVATNSSQLGSQLSYKGSNSMRNSQQQQWSQNRPQNTRETYRHQNNPHYVSNYDKRDQKNLNNHGLKAMGTYSKPYRQHQQFININNSTVVSTASSSSFYRGPNTSDLSSAGYQTRDRITNSSDFSTRIGARMNYFDHDDMFNGQQKQQNDVNSSQQFNSSSYKGSNSMSGSGYSQQQALNRPQKAHSSYQYPNNPHYMPNYNKRDQDSLNNSRNISNSTGVSTGSSSSPFSRGHNNPDFATRYSSGYRNRGSTSNNSDNLIWRRQTNDSDTQRDDNHN